MINKKEIKKYGKLKKILSFVLSVLLVITMTPMKTFATTGAAEGELVTSSISELDTTEATTKNTSPVNSISIDKKLLSEGETATITIKMSEGYTAEWIFLYKPITKNASIVYLNENSSGVYTGYFKVDDQTESGIWKVKSLTYKDSANEYQDLYNSETWSGSIYETMNFSEIDFEVIGTNADVTEPILKSFEIDKSIVSVGEKITISAIIEDEHPGYVYIVYKMPSGETKYIDLNRVDNQALYQGVLTIDKETEIGQWRPYYFYILDTNGNGGSIYNSVIYSYDLPKQDMSKLNFEVIDLGEDDTTTEEQESFIVIFKDGYGNTLSTQRVAKGEDATEPSAPTNELYLFDGWDSDFTNITSNKVINAKWILNPNVEYDKDIHVGETFEIKVYSTTSQTHTITCNEDIDFVSKQSGTGFVVVDSGAYYYKSYKITVNTPGSYLFYVKGSSSSNTLTYKVKVNDHKYTSTIIAPTCISKGYTEHTCNICKHSYKDNYVDKIDHSWKENFTVDVKATCEDTGVESIHCKYCDIVKEGSEKIIPALGHKKVIDESIDATCTTTGLTEGSHCSKCNKVFVKQETIPAKGHDLGDAIVTKKATTSSDGVCTYICKSCGETLREDPIAKISTVELSTTNYTYDGSKKTPTVIVKDSEGNELIEGSDYTLGSWKCVTGASASSRKSIGKYYITVNFKGNYSGSKKLYFTIGPKNPSSVKTSLYGYDDVKVSWSKVTGATGYRVYYKKSTSKTYTYLGYTTSTCYKKKANLSDGVKYDFKVVAYKKVNGYYCYNGGKTSSIYTLKKVLGVTVTKSGTKAKVSWTNISGESGYQISQSTSKTGTKIVSTYSTTTGKYKTITATKGKTYYYKVRAYKVVDGNKIYAPWSTAVKFVRK